MFAATLGAGVLLAATGNVFAAERAPRGKKKATDNAAVATSMARHPATRTTAAPRDGEVVPVNPPPLLWPTGSLGEARYAVRLSRDPAFADAGTVRASGLRWAMYNAHQRLAPGRWYWQYTIERPGHPVAWSDRHEFVIDAATRSFVTPDAEAALDAVPAGHPRILARESELAELRRRAAADPDCAALVARARKLATARLPAPEKAKPAQKGSSAFEEKNFAKWASKGFAGDFAQDVAVLAPAYLLSGDESLGRAALARALFIAGLDPDGDTSPKVSDFADGSCMRAMALAYDSCFALLAPAERDQLRHAMAVRGGRFFRQQINKLEGRIFSPHIWQHILAEAAEIAWATLGEVPDARAWAGYVYELWLNRFPTVGGADGGWTEGLGYLGTNIETMLLMPQRLGQLTGVDFHDIPWYRHAADFHLYGWPVGSVNAGFGDGDHDSKTISAARAYFVGSLGRRFGQREAVRYAEAATRGKSDALPPLLVWHRLRDAGGELVPAAPAEPRPLSRAFHDVGLVAMHTDREDSRRNVFVAVNSCPFGAYGHMHPAQNAFNLMLGGERLFANSGYYIAFGDAHFKGWYHHSRGHNTVLIDGQGQTSDSEGWGWIARHADSRAIAYTLGDASPAYGNAGLTRFRRHVALLRPATVVIYDELEARHEAQWSWLLHSPARIEPKPGGARFRAVTAAGEGQVDVFGSYDLRVMIDDRFDPPADNWRGKKSGGSVIEYPNQWHATIEPDRKSDRLRVLAVIQLRLSGSGVALPSPQLDGAGRLQIGEWTIAAELKAREPARLVIENTRGRHALATGVPGIRVDGRQHPVAANETLLVDGATAFRAIERSP